MTNANCFGRFPVFFSTVKRNRLTNQYSWRLKMKTFAARLLLLIVLAPLTLSVQAQEFAGSQALQDKLVQAIVTASQGQLEILAIKETPLGNMFEVELNTGELLYSDISGDYLFAGDMYQTTGAGLMNLSSSTRQIRTLERIATIPEDQMIIFDPENEIQATLTVFTDVDCTYCRALHRDMEDLLAKGIRIRYLAYPRGGEGAGSFDKMISVWCSEDRHKSLTQAKNGQNLPIRDCETPVMSHYDVGNQIGISGTPALIFPDGRVIPGYMDVDRLVAMLNIN
ncbi:MAG: thioredoxin fold domain-containing protein [Pseudomonadales bacterium]|nr:thioredoxin fold domain-containing protein [Pseudomonadales bacterium]